MGINKGDVKVHKLIRAIPFDRRELFDIEIGEDYFISFGNNIATPCVLDEINDSEGNNTIHVKIKRRNYESKHILFRDEIGRTPEEAVRNEVTF